MVIVMVRQIYRIHYQVINSYHLAYAYWLLFIFHIHEMGPYLLHYFTDDNAVDVVKSIIRRLNEAHPIFLNLSDHHPF